MQILKSINSSVAAFLLATCSSITHAALVTYTMDGSVTSYGTASNDFGITSLPTTISASFTFDDSLIPGGTGTIDYTDFNASGAGVSIVFPSLTFDESMDNGSMVLELTSGSFTSFVYAGTDGAGNTLSSNSFNFFQGNDVSADFIFGNWQTGTFQQAAVPVPAAVWLFGSGLLGLAGIAGKKKSR